MTRAAASSPARTRLAWAGLAWLLASPAHAGPALRRPSPEPLLAPDRALPDLESLGDGRLRHRGDGFVALVRGDGSVEFRDVVDHDLSYFGFRRRRLELAPLDTRSPLVVDFAERAMFPMGRLPVAGLGGRFGGLADWTLGQRHAAAKRAFLDATVGLRTRLAYAWRRARAQEQLAALGEHLLRAWRDPRRSLAERKQLLFAAWDECAEPDPAAASPFDRLLGAAGSHARGKIAAFVRLVAPEGSPEAFTADELARLNATRRSLARFAPYAADVPPLPALPELPEQPEPESPPAVDDPAAPAYGPTPEPSVGPTRRPGPDAAPAPKRRRPDNRSSVRIGPIQVPLRRR